MCSGSALGGGNVCGLRFACVGVTVRGHCVLSEV